MRALPIILALVLALTLAWAAVELAAHFKPQVVTGGAPQAPEERWRSER